MIEAIQDIGTRARELGLSAEMITVLAKARENGFAPKLSAATPRTPFEHVSV